MEELKLSSSVAWQSGQEFQESILRGLKGKTISLFCTNSSLERLNLHKFLEEMIKQTDLLHISDIPSLPSYKDIYRIIMKHNAVSPDVVLAIGGGSVIDTAKGVSGLLYLKEEEDFSPESILDALKHKSYLDHKSLLPIYALPTTAGTGSEVTKWATIWDMDNRVKYSIDAPWLLPQKVFMVAEYTKTMPLRLTLSTGLDALCHAVESYWAKASNRMTRVMSLAAIEIIVEYLPKVIANPADSFYREKMSLGSLYSGLAFSNTRTTACHSISYPLTMEFGIEHGLACVLTLAKVMEINLPAIIEKEVLFEKLKIAGPSDLQDWIDQVSEGIVKMRLSGFGIKMTDIPNLARLSFTQGRMDNNPVDISEDDVKQLLQAILE